MKRSLVPFLVSLSLILAAGGCAANHAAPPPKEADPALLALSEAGMEINRRHFRKARAEREKGSEGALYVNPRSELFVPYLMDFSWNGEARQALMSISSAIGWECEVIEGRGRGLVSIQRDLRGQKILELLFDLDRQIQGYGEEIGVDELRRRLVLKERS